MELFLIAVVILITLAIVDLMVGVSNDAVNFLNSSFGSRAASRRVIMIIASFGIMAGVVFSSGMMEVARKGIFHPQLFTMPELMTIFLAVMLTDVLLLDLFNTFGLPTSTTVSIVFELLGAAVVVSIIKIAKLGDDLANLGEYINTAKAMIIITGILLSVAVAFVCGAIVQFLTRLIFTFDYESRIRRYGALWGGVALASITYFILVKGAKGATFMSAEDVAWIRGHTWTILAACFAASAVILQILLFLKVNILKPIVLAGTFALALAFAANDLVNFIGVPLAGLAAFNAANATADPLNSSMEALGGKVMSQDLLLIVAGLIMVVTIWLSRKARSVSETEISLSQQEEANERFQSTALSRAIVRMAMSAGDIVKAVLPAIVLRGLRRRLDTTTYQADTDEENRPSFDLLRACVNLMVAGAVISFATSQKLPLSTTYVTFMVAMGSSFADQAWGRESAVYRVTGVLVVVGGWFMTALMAFTAAGLFAVILHFTGAYGGGALVLLAALAFTRTHRKHKQRVKKADDQKVFNLKKIKDAPLAISTTFTHAGHLIHEIRMSLHRTLDALYAQNPYRLERERKRTETIQEWANVIIANVFKAMRLLQKQEEAMSHKYAQTIRRLQKLADGHRDIVMRASDHVRNLHSGLLDIQVTELRKVGAILDEILLDVENALGQEHTVRYQSVLEKDRALRSLAQKLNQDQILRIQDEESKTRLSILFYAIVGNAMMLSKQNLKLMEIFGESFGGVVGTEEFDLD
jgi:phosphate/sulfate permease